MLGCQAKRHLSTTASKKQINYQHGGSTFTCDRFGNRVANQGFLIVCEVAFMNTYGLSDYKLRKLRREACNVSQYFCFDGYIIINIK